MGLYIAAALLWIIFAEGFLDWLLGDFARSSAIHLIRELVFILFSAGTIYLLIRRENRHRLRAETRLRQLSRAVEQSANAIIITDTDGHIEYVNPRFETLTGYPKGEVIGQNPRILKSGTKSSEDYANLWQAITTGQDWRGEFYNRRKSGGYYWASATISPIRNRRGEITHFVAVQEDITERKRAEDKLQQRNRELTLFNQVISAAASSLNAEEVLSVTCREMALTFDVPQVTIALLNKDGETFDVVAEFGSLQPGAESNIGLSLSVEGNPALECLRQDYTPCVFEDAQHDSGLASLREAFAKRGIVSTLLAPLLVRGEMIGLIALNTAEPRCFDEDDLSLAANVGTAVSQALDNARLYERVSRHNDVLLRAIGQHTEELQRVKDRVEAILNNSPDAILLLQPNGLIETANPTFLELFGIEQDVYNYPVAELVRMEDIPELRHAITVALQENRVMRLELTARCADGRLFDAGIALAAFDETDRQRLVCVVRDISALKEVERMKDAFVSNVSHELRTPITSLKLHEHLMRINPDKRDLYMDRLHREIERLSHIIEDLLTLSRMDQERLNLDLTPVDLNQLLMQYVTDRALMADAGGLEIVYNESRGLPQLEADRGMIGQVLGILLTNAFNYTPEGGRVTVEALKRSQNGVHWVGFSVSDTGYGIPLDEQPYVFDRFFRGEAAREIGSSGTGLGLAIAQEIIERHHGRIEVMSSGKPGEGAVFRVWLPVSPS